MHVQCDRVGDRREEVGQYADTVNMLAETTLDYSLITKAVILELDEGAPLEVADAVGGGGGPVLLVAHAGGRSCLRVCRADVTSHPVEYKMDCNSRTVSR